MKPGDLPATQTLTLGRLGRRDARLSARRQAAARPRPRQLESHVGTVLKRPALALAAALLSHAALADAASDRHQWQVEIDAGYVRGRQRSRAVDGGRPRQAALRRSERRPEIRAPVRAVSRPNLADAHRDRDRRLSRRRVVGPRLERSVHRLAPDPEVGQPAASAVRRVLPAAVARERRARLAQPVHVFVFRDQHLARRGDPADRRRVVAAPAARLRGLAARAARVRVGVLRQRPGRHAAVLARLVAARPPDASRRPPADAADADVELDRHDRRLHASSRSSRSRRSITSPAPTRASSGATRSACSCSSRITTTARTRGRSRTASGAGTRRSRTSACRRACRRSSASSRNGCAARPTGSQARARTARCPRSSALVEDEFSSRFLMLTRLVRGAHRVSAALRRVRDGPRRVRADVVLRRRPRLDGRLSLRAHRSSSAAASSGSRSPRERDLWSFYSPVTEATERQLRLQVTYRLRAPAR